MTLSECIKRNSIFLSLWLASVVALTIALCTVEKGSLHLLLCDHHSTWADILMPILSDTCNWLPYLTGVILLLWRWQAGVFVSVSLILSTLITQAFKHIVRAPRPLTWFAENMPDITLPLTEGVRMNYHLSFPSGHTTTFFCLYFALCALYTYYIYTPAPANGFWYKLLHKNQPTLSYERKASIGWSIVVQLLLFMVAAVSSYSRLYLSQHFALDVLAGMCIGVVSVAIVAHFYFRRKNPIPNLRTASRSNSSRTEG